MKKMVFFVAFAAAVLTSCVTYRLDPVAQNGVEVLQNRDERVASIQNAKIHVRVYGKLDGNSQFFLDVKNVSDQTVRIDSAQFRLYQGEKDRWSKLDVYNCDDYVNQVKTRLIAGGVLLVLGSIATRSSPSYSESTSVVVHERGSVTTIRTRVYRSEEDQWAIDARNAWYLANYARSGMDELEYLKNNLFFAVDLKPQEGYSGFVVCDNGKGPFFKLVVPIAGQDYEFVFERTQVRNRPF